MDMLCCCLLAAAISLLPAWPHDHVHERDVAHAECDHTQPDRGASGAPQPVDTCEICLVLQSLGASEIVLAQAPSCRPIVMDDVSVPADVRPRTGAYHVRQARSPPVFS